MKRRWITIVAAIFVSTVGLLAVVGLLGRADAEVLASVDALAVTAVDPASAPNDLDTAIVITGSDFVSTSAIYLGGTALSDVAWVSSTTLKATAPWGIEPGVYTLTVSNPGGESASLPGAFTIVQGIGVWTAGKLYGGGVGQVVINPFTPTTVYAVSDDVGMFRSTDGGANWAFKVAGGNYSVRNLVIDPISPTVIYMFMPWTLHRSDDGGDTWIPLYAPGDVPYPHPTEPGTVFVSNRWAGESGLWKSEDYGQTWLTMTTGLTETRVSNLVFHSTNPLTMYVGTEQGNIFVSSDGGASWSFVSKPLDFIQKLAINPRGDHELWASNCCFCRPHLTTLRSTNVGHTEWITVAEPVGSLSLRSIEFAPAAWGDVYSRTVFVSDCYNEVQKSADGGDTWESIDPQSNEWHWGLAVHPTDPDILYASGNRQGIYKTTDGGSSWQVANQGLTAVVPEQMATVAGQPDVVYALTGLGLLKGTQGGKAWQRLDVADGAGFIASDPFTPSRVYAAGGDMGGGDMPVYISEDGGQTWPITSYLTEPVQYSDWAHLDPIVHPDPSQPGVLLAGVRHYRMGVPGLDAGSIYRSTDYGEHWTLIDVGQVVSSVTDIAFDVISPTIVYMATGIWGQGTGVFRSIDGGQTWQRTGEGTAELNGVSDIAVEASPPYRVFAWTKAGVRTLYVSDDHGESWSRAGFPGGGIHVEQLLCTHQNPSVLYAATDEGLIRSRDGAQSWERAPGALGRVPVYSLAEAVADDRVIVYAGTTGGVVPSVVAQVQRAASAAGVGSTLVSAGVYRYTALLDVQVPGQAGWVQVSSDGFGDPANAVVGALDAFAGRLYAGTQNINGAQVWRTSGGREWSQVVSPWSLTNTAVLDAQVFGSHLYFGTAGSLGEVWRTDGVSWTQVTAAGFGDPNNQRISAFAVLSGVLYAAADNGATGLEIWRSASGDPGDWSQVNGDGFGDAGTTNIVMGVYSETLYVGASRNGVAELWRSDDGVTWTAVFSDGLGDPTNQWVSAMSAFDGEFYIGLRNTTTGGELWRSEDGLHWTQVFAGGLGNSDNVDPRTLAVYGDALYLAFANWTTGVEAWRTADGNTWERVNKNGWGDPRNSSCGYFDKGAAVFSGMLYVGTRNFFTGAEVWRYGYAVYLPLLLRE